jgi:hypothetical protein
MSLQDLVDIAFDEQDANLFLVDDARLRADALKHSVVPRLRMVMHEAIELIRDIYAIEVLEDSILSVFPNFREKRQRELEHIYEEAFVGLGGQRKAKWPGFARKDGKPVKILPFRFAFVLDQEYLYIIFENGWLTGLDAQSFETLLRFHIENEEKVNPLLFESQMRPEVFWAENLPIFAPLRKHYEYRIQHQLYDNHFLGHKHRLPVSGDQLVDLVHSFACFFPVYDSYIQMAKGQPDRLDALLVKLSDWHQMDEDDLNEEDLNKEDRIEEAHNEEDDLSVPRGVQDAAARAAETKVRVMPALRWQVFGRDQWKCVACGRNSHQGAILHVDHIIPRSLGGLDALDNFQTLCDVCNIGKGNRDRTNLRDQGSSSGRVD